MRVFSQVKIEDTYAVLIIDSEKFGHHEFVIDKEDAERVGTYSWSVMVSHYSDKWITYYYASSCTCKKKTGHYLLHRFIMDAPKGTMVDHIDRDTHNMRKSNMRICDGSTNCRNKKLQSNNSSGYRGVLLNHYGTLANHPKWYAYIDVHRRKIHLGYYDNLEDALAARKAGELKYFGAYVDDHCIPENSH